MSKREARTPPVGGSPTPSSLAPRSLRLPDGRSLSYRLYGNPAGIPVVNCHGGMVSGLDAEPAHAAAAEAGILIVSPNRPGVGDSDRHPDQGVLDWVKDDLAPLLDHLGISRFAVMGWSEGGQYALATACSMPERVHRVALIGAALPLDDHRNLADLNSTDRRLATLATRHPATAAAYFSVNRLAATFTPGMLASVAARALRPHDQHYLRTHAEWFARAVAEGSRNPRGASDEYREFIAPWGFELSQIITPVDVHQGDEDSVIDSRWADRLAAELPDSTLTRYPGEGHFVALTHRLPIMRELVRGWES